MALVTLTSRVEEADKASFEDFCSAVGMTALSICMSKLLYVIESFPLKLVKKILIPFIVKSTNLT